MRTPIKNPVDPMYAGSAEISLALAHEPHEAETLLGIPGRGTANALALWFSADLAAGVEAPPS